MANANQDPIQESKTTDQFQDPQVDRIPFNAAVKAVEAGHAQDVDIAAQILAEYGADEDRSWTPEEEKRLIRKVDWMIVPIVRMVMLHYEKQQLTIDIAVCVCHALGTRQDGHLGGGDLRHQERPEPVGQ